MKIINIKWGYEDELPEMADDEFNEIFSSSIVELIRFYLMRHNFAYGYVASQSTDSQEESEE